MAMNGNSAASDVMTELNITPLIDVMLVLLTLLLITLPVQTNAVKLDLPVAAPGTVPPPVVDIDIDFDGTAFWNGHAVDRPTLGAYLRRAARQSPQPELHLHANRLARYDAVAKILSDAQGIGIAHIGIVGTERFVH